MKKTAFIGLAFAFIMTVNTFAEVNMNYVNDGMVTTADTYSLAGKCDPTYPLYINGEKIDVTAGGYFCDYVKLSEGKNTFVFKNGDESKTYTIIKDKEEQSVKEDTFTPISFVGEVNRNNPTVRSRPDEANDDIVTPYAKGTLLNIVGENSEYYKTSNGNYLYKIVVNNTDKKYGDNTVKNINFAKNTLVFEMDRPVEYAVDLTDAGMSITLYDTKNNADVSNPNTEIFESAEFTDKGYTVYNFKFKNNGSVIGYKPVIEDDKISFVLNMATVTDKKSLSGTTVVLDAGHGGADSGTLGLGSVYEKTVTLSITDSVKSYLEDKGAEVVLTRPKDVSVGLNDRTAIIDKTMPDLAVSIHCNSRNERDDFNELSGMLNLHTFNSSTGLVESMNESFSAKSEKSNLAMTRITTCPAILIETGYMSNPAEYESLIKEETQKQIAKKIGTAIEKYLHGCAQNNDATSQNEIVIYHTNDSHGYLKGDNEKIVGIDKVAALKDSTPGSLLIDAGDATQGLPLASITQGEDVIDLMNMADYDLMAPGNHEFDYGKEQFVSNVKRAEFPVVAANVYDGDKLILEDVSADNKGCHKIIEKDGVKIGFFGLTTTQTASATNPEGIKGLEFKNEIECAKREIDELNAEDADVIIAVCHMGNADADCTSTELAQAMTGKYKGELDAIIDGHSHTVENVIENDVLIAQTGSGMSAVGKLTIGVSDEDVEITDELIGAKDLADIAGDTEVVAKLEQISADQTKLLEERLGTADTTLWAGWIGDIGITRFVETNYGDFAADAFKTAGEAFVKNKGVSIPVIGVENGGGIREAVPNGTITKGSLIATFPFANIIYLKEVTPEIIYNMMEVSGGLLDGIDHETGMLLQQKISGGFLQISGFKVVYNPDSEGNKVVSITLDGETKPLDRNDSTRKIMLVSNNYIMNGGNDYTMLGDLPKYGEIGGEVETIQAYLTSCLANGTLQGYSGIKNRIVMQGGYTPKPYTASIKITDSNGEPMVNKDVSYRVDGGKKINAVTDSKGMLAVDVTDGPHGIRLSDNQKEVYVNNYAGIGITEDALRSYPVLKFLPDGNESDVEETTTEAKNTGKGSSGSAASFEKTNATADKEPQDDYKFSDTKGHWAENEIKRLVETGIITGYPNGSFKPDKSITRAEFLALLYKSGVYDFDTSKSVLTFNDVSKDSWYYNCLLWGYSVGIVTGYEDNSFRADNCITREEMAVVISRLLELTKEEDSGKEPITFADKDKISLWAKQYVDKLSANDIVRGDNNNCFMPDKNLTRAEATVITNKVVGFCNMQDAIR